MKRFNRRFIAILLSMLMVLSQMSVTAFAFDELGTPNTDDPVVSQEPADTTEQDKKTETTEGTASGQDGEGSGVVENTDPDTTPQSGGQLLGSTPLRADPPAAHTHTWQVEFVPNKTNTAVVTCTAGGCEYAEGKKIKIYNPDNLLYNGEVKEARIVKLNEGFPGEDVGVVVSGISYVDANTGTALNGAPVDAGKYTASATVSAGDQSVTMTTSFKIAPIEDPVTVTITGNKSLNNPYNGEVQSVNGFTATATNDLYDVEGEDKDFTFSGNDVAEREDVGKGYMFLESQLDKFTNVSKNFTNVTFAVPAEDGDGYVEVVPLDVKVTVTGKTKTVPYDGKTHAVKGYTAVADSALYSVSDFTEFSGTQYASQTNVGKKYMGMKASDFKNVGTNYNVTYEVTDGYQEITAADVVVTVTGKQSDVTYDGKEHSVEGYDVSSSNPAYTAADFEFTGEAKATRTDAGKTDMGLTADQFKNKNNNYNAQFVVDKDGALTVEPKEITDPIIVVHGSESIEYDGTPQTPTVTVKDGETDIIPAEEYTVSYENNVKAGTATVKITDKEGGNYDVSGSEDFTISKKDLTITADSASKTYDGTPLVKDHVTSTGTAEGDTLKSVTVTGTQTDVGTSDNVPSDAVIKNGADEDVTACYNITYENGTLEVKEGTFGVTITAKSATKVYDGTPLTKNSYTATKLDGDDHFYDVVITGSQTIAGQSENVASDAVIVDSQGRDVTQKYKITYKKGTLTVTQKPLTITAASDEKVFDGEALEKNSYSNSDLAENDSIKSVKISGSQRNAGDGENVASNAKIENKAGTDVTACYDITYVKGTLKVTARPIEITADSATREYDGTPLTKSTASVTGGTLVSKHELGRVTTEGSQTIVGDEDNVLKSVKIYRDRTLLPDVEETANYAITLKNGKLSVTEKPLTITAASDEKVYDGKSLKNDGWTSEGLVDGDTLSAVTVAGGRLKAGSADNVASGGTVTNAKGDDVTACYDISYETGLLVVDKAPLTITAASDSKDYDGEALTNDDWDSEGLVDGDTLTDVTVVGEQTEVGSSENVASGGTVTNAKGDDVTACYDITYKDGTLVVGKKLVTIVGLSASDKTYDGNDTATVTGTAEVAGVAPGAKVSVVPGKATFSNERVGTDKTVRFSGYSLTGEDADQYTLASQPASVKASITAKEVTITGLSAKDKVYDGKTDATVTGTAVVDGVVKGDSVSVKAGNAAFVNKNVGGTKAVKFTGYSLTGRDAGNYTLSAQPADVTAKITAKEVTITGLSAEDKIYDGNTSVTLTGEAAVNGKVGEDDVSVDPGTAAFEDKNAADNKTVTFSGYKLKGNDAGNYSLTAQPEAVTANIAKRDATIKNVTAANKTYDGTRNATVSIASAYVPEYVTGDKLSIKAGSGRFDSSDVGTDKKVELSGFTLIGDDADNYNLTAQPADAKANITQAALKIKTSGAEKVYDGTALTKSAYTTEGLLEGDWIVPGSIDYTGSQTIAGSSKNTASGAIVWSGVWGGAVTDNYKIEYDCGDLVVTKRPVTITADSATKTYDGKPLTKQGASANDLAEGDTLEGVVTTGSQTTAETSDNTVTAAYIKNSKGEDVTSSYDPTLAAGKLTVTKRALTVTAKSASKDYDGTALTKNEWESKGLVEGEELTGVTVTGSQTEVGSSANVASGGTVKSGETDVTDCYEFTYVDGTLAVGKKLVTISGVGAAGKTYDGNKNADITGTPIIVGALQTDDVNVVTGKATFNNENVGTDKTVTFSGYSLTGKDAGKYVLSAQPAPVKANIIAKSVTVTGLSASDKVYDGTVDATIKGSAVLEGVVKGDNVSLKAGKASFANKNKEIDKTVTFSGYSLTGRDADNYSLTQPAAVTATIKAKDVTITGLSAANKTYDGKTSATPTGEAVIDGKVEDDDVNVSAGTAAFADKTADVDKTVTFSGYTLSGKDAANYNLKAQPEAVTANIYSKEVTIEGVTAANKTYDGYKKATVDMSKAYVDGWVSGDDLSIVEGTASFTSSDAGTNKTVEFSGFGLEGDDADNYLLKSLPADVKADITPAPLTITAGSAEKVYDGSALTKDSHKTVGLLEGDWVVPGSVRVTGSQTIAGTAVNKASGAIVMSGVWGGNVTKNYDIDYVDGTLTVTKRPVTITADSASQVYNGKPLTKQSATADNLAKGDTLDGVVTQGSQTDAGDSANTIVSVAIKNKKGDNVTSSYEPTLAEGKLTVRQRLIWVYADDKSKRYGEADPELTYTADSLIGSDEFSGSITRESGENCGEYAITQGTLTAGDNYEIVFGDGTFTIEQRTLKIIADSKSKTYGDPDPELTYQTSGLLPGDRIKGSLERDPGEDSGAYTINQGSLTANDNYKISYTAAIFTINANKAALNDSIAQAQSYYDSIKDSYADIASALLAAIQSAQSVAEMADPSQATVNSAVFSIQTAVKTANDNVQAVIAAKAANNAAYAPGYVKLKKVSKGNKSLKVTIKRASKNITGYQVMVTNLKTGETKIVNAKQSKKTSKVVNKTVKKLAKKTKYNVQVRGYNVVNNETYFGPWSNVKTGKTR